MKLNREIQRYMCQSNNQSNLWECSLAILSEHNWNITWEMKNDRWYLYSDDKTIYSAKSFSEIEAFTLGLAFTNKEIANHRS